MWETRNNSGVTYMEITKHAIKRYVERIEEIKEELEVNRYITMNSDLVKERIQKIYEYSKWIYKGQIGTDKTTANFYIKDDIILVGDVQETKIYTLYRIDFGFPAKTTKVIIKDLIDAIDDTRLKLDEAQKDVEEYIEEKRHEVDSLDLEINNLRRQIKILDEQREAATMCITAKQDSLQLYHKTIDNYANKLCNSLEFKKDINANAIKSC
jgi:polyhydroxyalkanoate synthesis regulator phasin